MSKSQKSVRTEMILRNKPLVTMVVNRLSGDRYSILGLDREDAISYGVEGLIQAVDSFDASRGTTFASFAVQRIRGSILDAIRREDPLPRSLRRSTREVEKAAQELATALGRWPTEKELAVRLGRSRSEVREVRRHAASRFLSLEHVLDERARDDGSLSWDPVDEDDRGDPPVAAERNAALRRLGEMIGLLSKRDQRLLRLRYGESRPFHEVGGILGLSESRVCQLHKRILRQLRTWLSEPAAEEAA
ncbi:MAG: sigma-70 family RNA polymerase sigma factor [Chloroflexi bacterium]|nr:sigma-70 family RNA polymerase sigma factor [Chloroflexota bacterium]